MIANKYSSEAFVVKIIDEQTLMLAIFRPAPWLWKSKENILKSVQTGRHKLIIDLSHLRAEEVTPFTLGDYLRNISDSGIATIALVGNQELIEELPYFVQNVSSASAQGFDNFNAAAQWLKQ